MFSVSFVVGLSKKVNQNILVNLYSDWNFTNYGEVRRNATERAAGGCIALQSFFVKKQHEDETKPVSNLSRKLAKHHAIMSLLS